jgi:hypothetical protein
MHGLSVLALGLLFSAPSLDDVNRAVKTVLADSGIQTEYPGEDGAEPPAPSNRTHEPRARRDPGVVWGGSEIVTTLLWVLVGVGVVLLVVWLARELQGYTRVVEVEEMAAVAQPRAPPTEAPLGDAETLAAEGRYEEAVHLLLLHALRSIEREGTRIASHTSREVVRAAHLEGAPHDAVLGLVGAVEISLFGGRPIDETGYRTAADHYRRLLAATA